MANNNNVFINVTSVTVAGMTFQVTLATSTDNVSKRVEIMNQPDNLAKIQEQVKQQLETITVTGIKSSKEFAPKQAMDGMFSDIEDDSTV